MAKPESVFIYIGTYVDEAAARDDYQIVKDLHSAGGVGTYDAAVVTKDYDGKVHVNKDEMATRHGAWGGAAVGAVVGESKIEQGVEKATLKAEKHVAKELDVKPSDIDAAIREAAGEMS